MATNDTDQWVYVSPTGQALFLAPGESPPSGSTVLVCPGGTIDDALAERHGIAGKLGADPAVRRDGAGNPIVVRGGRAIAADVLPDDDEGARAAMEAAREEDDAKAKRAAQEDAKAADEAEEADVKAAREVVDAHEAKARAKAKAPEAKDIESKAIHRTDATVEDKAIRIGDPKAAPPRKAK
jgi:hypothetical protein